MFFEYISQNDMNGFYVSEEVSFSSLFATPITKNIKNNQIKTLKNILKTNFDENSVARSDKPKHVFFNEKIKVIWGCGESSDEILNDTKCSLSLHRSPLKRVLNKRFWSFKRSKKQTKHSAKEQEEEEDDEELYIVDDLEANVPIVVLKRNIDCFKCNVTAPLATMDDLGVFENFSDEEDDGGWIDGIDEESDKDDTIINNEIIKNNELYKENIKENIIENIDNNCKSLIDNKIHNEHDFPVKDKECNKAKDLCNNDNNEWHINDLEMMNISVHETIPSEVTKDINNNKVLHSLVGEVDNNFINNKTTNNMNIINKSHNKNYFLKEINNNNLMDKINNSIEQLLAKDIENKRVSKNRNGGMRIEDITSLPDDVAIIYNENFKTDTHCVSKSDFNNKNKSSNNKNNAHIFDTTFDNISSYDEIDMMGKEEASCNYKVNSNITQDLTNNNDEDNCLVSSIESIEKCVYDIQIKEVANNKYDDGNNGGDKNLNYTANDNDEIDGLNGTDKELLIEVDDDNYCICPSYPKESHYNVHNNNNNSSNTTKNINNNFADSKNDTEIKIDMSNDISKTRSLVDVINNNATSNVNNNKDEADESNENTNVDNLHYNKDLKDFPKKDNNEINGTKDVNNYEDNHINVVEKGFKDGINDKGNKRKENYGKQYNSTKYQKKITNIRTKKKMENLTSAKETHQQKLSFLLEKNEKKNRQKTKISESNSQKMNERLVDRENIKVNEKIVKKNGERMEKIKDKSLIIKKDNIEKKERTNEKIKLANYDNNIRDRQNKMIKSQKSLQNRKKGTIEKEQGFDERQIDFPLSSSLQLHKSLVWSFHQDTL